MKKIQCHECECVHHGDGTACEAEHILVRQAEGDAACNTFESTPVEANTASERMMGVGNGMIGDGEMTLDYFRVEFAEPPDGTETIANATVGCTVSECIHNHRYVCNAGSIAIGTSGEAAYYSTRCQTYEPFDAS